MSRGMSRAAAALAAVVAAAGQTSSLVWTQSTSAAVYTTASISRHPGGAPSFAAATWLTSPIEIEVYNISDSGGAVWSYEGSGKIDSAFWATMARHVERAPNASSTVDLFTVESTGLGTAGDCVLRAFDSLGPGTPAWNFTVVACQAASIDMTDDGAVALFSAWVQNGSALSPTLWCFDAGTGNLRWSLVRPLGGPATLSSDGAWLAWTLGDDAVVFDTATGTQRAPAVNMGWNTPAQLTAGAAALVFAGQDDAQIWVWSAPGGAYVQQSSLVPTGSPSWDADSVSISDNSPTYGTLAHVCWFGPGFLTARMLSYTLNGTLVSDWTSPTNAKLQTACVLASDADFVGAALWGDRDDYPTAVLLRAGNSTPAFTYVTPGSMMDADLVVAGDSGPAAQQVYFSVAGKHVPANVMGNGGDAYTWLVDFS